MLVTLVSCHLRESADVKINDVHHQISKPREIQIFVASSLHRIVSEWKNKQKRPVYVQSASSSKIKRWIDHGQSPDLFISADRKSIHPLIKTKSLSWIYRFACTPLVVVTRVTEPSSSSVQKSPRSVGGFKSWSDQNQGSIAIAMGTVPLGIYTQSLFLKGEKRWGKQWRERIKKRIVVQGINASSTSMYVRVNEVESALLYYVNALEMEKDKDLKILFPPEEISTHATYWIGGRDMKTQPLARDLIEFTVSSSPVNSSTGLTRCSPPLID